MTRFGLGRAMKSRVARTSLSILIGSVPPRLLASFGSLLGEGGWGRGREDAGRMLDVDEDRMKRWHGL